MPMASKIANNIIIKPEDIIRVTHGHRFLTRLWSCKQNTFTIARNCFIIIITNKQNKCFAKNIIPKQAIVIPKGTNKAATSVGLNAENEYS